MDILTALLIGYLSGSIPFGYLFSRAAGLGDIRKIGSGNIGATNVLRTGRRKLAALTLACDAAKGFIPVILASFLGGPFAAAAAGLAAFAGHLFPVWLGFRGGKGVATYIGVFAGLFWPAAGFFCAIWLAIALASRYSSLAALFAAALTPAFVYVFAPSLLGTVALFLSALLIVRHLKNIRNLIAGHETRIGDRAS